MDSETKVQWMQHLMQEEPYAPILQQFNDNPECREQIRPGKKYRLKRGSLCLHEDNQEPGQRYWRIVVPEDQAIKTSILKEIHCVPLAGHPGYTRTLQMTKRFFYWSHMTPEVRQFVLDCPVCQVEKGSSQLPAGKIMPLEIPQRKWDQVVLDFVVGLPVQGQYDAISALWWTKPPKCVILSLVVNPYPPNKWQKCTGPT